MLAIRGVSTPAMRVAVLRSWVNGWPTSGRFATEARPCRFGCGRGHDRLERYLVCEEVATLQRRVLRGVPIADTVSRLLLLEDEPESVRMECSLCRALFLFGLLGSYNAARAGRTQLRGPALEDNWRARAQAALVAKPSLQSTLGPFLQ